MIGVGITTLNRFKSFKKCLDSVLLKSWKNTKVVVADDGSTDDTEAYCKKRGVQFIKSKRGGIAANKNKALEALQDCGSLVLLDDDVVVRVRGWNFKLHKAFKVIGENHFSVSLLKRKNDRIVRAGGYTLRFPHRANGHCLFFSAKALEVCGGFDPRFKLYGGEHGEFSYRIWKAGLTRGYAPHLTGSDQWVNIMKGVPSVLPHDLKVKSCSENAKVRNVSNRQTARGVFYREFRTKPSKE